MPFGFQKLKLCDDESEDQLIGLLKKYHLPFELKTPLSVEILRNAMMNDKKVQKAIYVHCNAKNWKSLGSGFSGFGTCD